MAEHTGCECGRDEAQRQPGGAALTGVAGGAALLRPVAPGSEGQ